MQVVILSDVHGNLTAMRTVLADIHKQMPDYTVFSGDLCVFGAYPADTLALKAGVVVLVVLVLYLGSFKTESSEAESASPAA